MFIALVGADCLAGVSRRRLGFTVVDYAAASRQEEPRRVVKIRHRKSSRESKWATMIMSLTDASVVVQDVTDFWTSQPFDLMLTTINCKTLDGNCDLCFLKGANQV